MSEKIPPSFDSFEEMQAFLDAQESSPTPKKSAKQAKPSSPQLDKEEDCAKVWRVEHYYLREGYNWNGLLNDAKDAASMGNPETNKVFVHNHVLGQECNNPCRYIEVKE